MPAVTLPTINGGYIGVYPLKSDIAAITRVNRFKDGTEQRWQIRQPLGQWTLQLNQINLTDRNTMDSFVESQFGPDGQGWQFATPFPGSGATYPTCAFTQGAFTWTEAMQEIYSGQITFRQVHAGGLPAASGTAFPTLSFGVTGYPFIEANDWYVISEDMECGSRFSFNYYGNIGLVGFPAGALKRFTLTLGPLGDADLALLIEHFIAMGGRWGEFNFTHPTTAVVYTTMRYDMDVFSASRVAPGMSMVSIQLMQSAN
jgi:hypothetical protein